METSANIIEKDIHEASIDELEALIMGLEGLDDSDIIEEETEESSSELKIASSDDIDFNDIELDETLFEQVAKAIKTKESTEEAYDEQESTDDHVEKVETTKAEKEEKVKKAKAASTPRATRFTHSREELIAMKANPTFYLLEKGDLDLDEAGQKAKNEQVLEAIKKMNVKTGQKCVNLLSAANGTTKLGTFIEQGIRYILTEPKITKADMIEYYMSAARNKVKAYNKSTATPQASTLLPLFTELKMIVNESGVYKLNDNSLLLEHFRALVSH